MITARRTRADSGLVALAIRPASPDTPAAFAATSSLDCQAATQSILLSDGAMVYLSAALEYMAAEVLELSGNAARDHRREKVHRINRMQL